METNLLCVCVRLGGKRCKVHYSSLGIAVCMLFFACLGVRKQAARTLLQCDSEEAVRSVAAFDRERAHPWHRLLHPSFWAESGFRYSFKISLTTRLSGSTRQRWSIWSNSVSLKVCWELMQWGSGGVIPSRFFFTCLWIEMWSFSPSHSLQHRLPGRVRNTFSICRWFAISLLYSVWNGSLHFLERT